MKTVADTELLYPLTLFRRNNGETLPLFQVVEEELMPEPYRTLLVHTGDMTSRLEAFHRSDIVLSVLHREQTETAYRREVVLRTEGAGLPVEYGAIEINLNAFAPSLRLKILEGRLPLGGLLNTYHVRYRSRPKAFIKLGPDEMMSRIFHTPLAQEFYGRCNELLGEDDRVLARIVELLRP